MSSTPTPEASRGHLLQQVEAVLTPEEHEHAAVYLNETVQPAGVVQAGNASFTTTRPTYIVFIDGKPGGNWMHPCRYLAVPVDAGSVSAANADAPPAFGPLAANWTLLWRARSVQDWQLLPLSAATATDFTT